MKVLIERNEKVFFVNDKGKNMTKKEVVRKVVTDGQWKRAQKMDENVDSDYQWKLIYEFKEGEKTTKNPKKKEVVKKDSPELIQARIDYEKEFKKKPNHLMKLETLLEKIKEKVEKES